MAFFQETDQLIAIGEALFSALNKHNDATQKLPLFFKLIHQYFIEKGFKEGALKDSLQACKMRIKPSTRAW